MAIVVAAGQPVSDGPLLNYVSCLQTACGSVVANFEASSGGVLDSWIAEVLEQPELGVLVPPPPLALPNCRASFDRLREPLTQLSARLVARDKGLASGPSRDTLQVVAAALPSIECAHPRSPNKNRKPPSPCEESPTKYAKTRHHADNESKCPFASVPSPCRAVPSAMQHLGPKPLDPKLLDPPLKNAGIFPWSDAAVSSHRPNARSSVDASSSAKAFAPAWQNSKLFQPAPTVQASTNVPSAPIAPTAQPAPTAPTVPHALPTLSAASLVSPGDAHVAKTTSTKADTLEDSSASKVSEIRRKFENTQSTPCLHKSGMDATSMFAPMPLSATSSAPLTSSWRGPAVLAKSASAAGALDTASISSGPEAAKPRPIEALKLEVKSLKDVKQSESAEQDKKQGQCEPKHRASINFVLPQAQSAPESPALLVTPRQKMRPAVPAFKEKPEPWMALRQIRLPPASAEDNYEISDQDSDVEALESRDRSKKNVPKWCASYAETVLKQGDWDPDSIFSSRVPECNLDDIFPDALYAQAKKQKPMRKRGSSQDWKKDRLTKTDVAYYKSRMRQTKCWDESKAAKP